MINRDEIYTNLRSWAEKSSEQVNTDFIDKIFLSSEELKSFAIVYCPTRSYLSNIFKLGWLLGKKLLIVTPHAAFHHFVHDSTYGEDNTNKHLIEREYFSWNKQLSKYSEQILLAPSVYINLTKDYYSDESYPDVMFSEIKSNNLQQSFTLPKDYFILEGFKKINIDIPQLVIKDSKTLKKVQEDYPIAAYEFNQLLKSSHTAINCEDSASETQLIEKLQDEIIAPGVSKITQEYKEIYKSFTIKSVAEITGIGVPIYFTSSVNPDELIAKLLAAGMGLKLAQNAVELRKNLVNIKKKPLFAAMKMNFKC